MRISAKILVLALALVMVFTFAGCGANPEEQIKGEWTAEIELSKFMEDDDSGFLTFLKDTDLAIELSMEFDDGEVTMKMDASDAVKTDEFKKATKDFLLSESGVTEEQIEQEAGISIDEYVEEAASEFQNTLSETTTDSYKFEGDKLFVGDEEEKYEFKDDNTLIIESDDWGEIEFKKK